MTRPFEDLRAVRELVERLRDPEPFTTPLITFAYAHQDRQAYGVALVIDTGYCRIGNARAAARELAEALAEILPGEQAGGGVASSRAYGQHIASVLETSPPACGCGCHSGMIFR